MQFKLPGYACFLFVGCLLSCVPLRVAAQCDPVLPAYFKAQSKPPVSSRLMRRHLFFVSLFNGFWPMPDNFVLNYSTSRASNEMRFSSVPICQGMTQPTPCDEHLSGAISIGATKEKPILTSGFEGGFTANKLSRTYSGVCDGLNVKIITTPLYVNAALSDKKKIYQMVYVYNKTTYVSIYSDNRYLWWALLSIYADSRSTIP